MMRIKDFSLADYVKEALKRAEYSRDENDVVIAKVPQASGFFSQGDSFEAARQNLQEVIEGNVLLALQLGLDIPHIEGVEIKERQVAGTGRKYGKAHAS